MADERTDLIKRLAPLVLEDRSRAAADKRSTDIKGGTAIKLAENVTAKFKVKEGTVIVTRAEKHERQNSL